ncbi:hypothetical protein NLU13_1548 [Sarocladium strictum]|uniref:Uncharacterized protein n=1 Tax=Sarocladium strictum TaxID=5046 RepID=A0AA39GR68_SARSR|nr:hypothetical protein NLU13_1548 [Sarocladium strictum]
MSPNKAPSEGQKVDLGQNAPTKTEGTGAVASESLAAESTHKGGGFASNPSSRSENISANGNQSSSTIRNANTGSSNTEGSSVASAGTAPTYVNAQYIKGSGPHGKNITEGFDDSKTEDGIKKAFNADLGSINDPSRQAEQQFELNQNAQSRGAGPRQGNLTNETKYDALDANANA